MFNNSPKLTSNSNSSVTTTTTNTQVATNTTTNTLDGGLNSMIQRYQPNHNSMTGNEALSMSISGGGGGGIGFSNTSGNNNNTSSSSRGDTSKSNEYVEERETCLQYFDKWSADEQTEFVEQCLRRMCHFQQCHINNLLKPMLQRDFISSLPIKGLLSIAEMILAYLDARSLCSAELVCREWLRVISEGMLWKKLIERMVLTDDMWRGLSVHRGWEKFLFKMGSKFIVNCNVYEQHKFYKELYARILNDKEVC